MIKKITKYSKIKKNKKNVREKIKINNIKIILFNILLLIQIVKNNKMNYNKFKITNNNNQIVIKIKLANNNK